MRRFFTLFTLFVACTIGKVSAQVGVGTETPHASSVLDVTSTTKGMLTPRLTDAQKNAITSPATGLVIYQTTTPTGFQYYDGTAWLRLVNEKEIFKPTFVATILPGAVKLNLLGTTKKVVFNSALLNLSNDVSWNATTAEFTFASAGTYVLEYRFGSSVNLVASSRLLENGVEIPYSKVGGTTVSKFEAKTIKEIAAGSKITFEFDAFISLTLADDGYFSITKLK